MILDCRKAVLDQRPAGDDAVAQKAQAEAMRRTPIEQKGYTQGYENGAKMVLEALARNCKPYLVSLDQPSVADGSIPKPSIEVDPDTGFPLRRHREPSIPGFANGLVDGFNWALHTFGNRLIHPLPLPALPTEWHPWYEGIVLNDGDLKVQVFQEGRWLIWQFSTAGFPARRRAHIADGWGIRRMALEKGVLWVDTPSYGSIALDIEEGMIRNILPSPPFQVGMEGGAVSGDVFSEVKIVGTNSLDDLKQRVDKGDAKAMVELAFSLLDYSDPEHVEAEQAALFKRAADLGNPEGAYNLGFRYWGGSGVPKDLKAAKTYFQKAAQLGHPEAKAALEALASTEASH